MVFTFSPKPSFSTHYIGDGIISTFAKLTAGKRSLLMLPDSSGQPKLPQPLGICNSCHFIELYNRHPLLPQNLPHQNAIRHRKITLKRAYLLETNKTKPLVLPNQQSPHSPSL
jgi:hypothetical protein